MPDQPTYRPVHKALHRPLTVCGVDRRLFFLALLMGGATFNLLLVLVRRPGVCRPLWLRAGRRTAIQTCCASSSRRPEAGVDDPGKHERFDVEVVPW